MTNNQFRTIAGILCFIASHQLVASCFFLSCIWGGAGGFFLGRAAVSALATPYRKPTRHNYDKN